MSSALGSFSKSMAYWNPEQPPPVTPTRMPWPASPSRAMASFTISIALAVRTMGLAGAASGARAVGAMTVASMCFDLQWGPAGVLVAPENCNSRPRALQRKRPWREGRPRRSAAAVQAAAPVHGQDRPGDVRRLRQVQDRLGHVLRRPRAAQRDAP